MYPYVIEALAEQRIADLHRDADQRRLATVARARHGANADGSLAREGGRRIPALGRRQYRQVELFWPDGACTVVPARSDESARPLASSRP